MNNQRFLPRFLGGRSGAEISGGLSNRLSGPFHLARDRLAHALLTRPSPNPVKPFPHSPVMPAPLGRIGHLEVRLAVSPAEIKIAQELRYRVFFEEMSAVASADARRARRDADAFDAICDHLLVIDHGIHRNPAQRYGRIHQAFLKPAPAIVGTYRLLRQQVAEAHDGFYSQGEYDIAPLIAAHPQLNFLELGRSCVLEAYRDKRTVELLWHGIWAYVLKHGIHVMLGCASLEGTDPDDLAMPLSFLHHMAKAPDAWQVRAHDARREAMDRLPADAINPKAALKTLPPLIKGYLRLGGFVGDGAVVDHEFGTTDVLIILPVANINPRYIAHYGADAGRYAD
jgi:putative hemolysin